ncbi:MAG: hypothetical protein CSA62_05910 [Planctomycetota bacterium]|nr:MAG: hypothetical protein CSA62_05910 [Planctomycetota bacterium]
MDPIAFDASCLVNERSTGVERSFLITLEAFTKLPDMPPCVVYRPAQSRTELPPGVEIREIPRLPLSLWRSTLLPRALHEENAAALLSPTTALPRLAPCPRIATVHELPGGYAGAREHAFEELRHERAIDGLPQRADRVLVPSEHTRRDLLRRSPVLAPRTRVQPQPLHPYFLEPYPAVPFSARRGLLFVGQSRRRKNLPRILHAWEQLPEALRLEHPLFWVGGAIDAGGQKGLASGIELLPELDQTEIVHRMSLVRGLLLPSLSEGFGIPALEALAVGTPVLGSKGSVTEELCGELSTLVDPYDVHAILIAMEELLRSPAAWERSSASGPELAAKYTPALSAEHWRSVLEELGVMG